jgi:O-antigen ligase
MITLIYLIGLILIVMGVPYLVRCGVKREWLLIGLALWSGVLVFIPNFDAWINEGQRLTDWRVKFEHNNSAALFNLIAFVLLVTGQGKRPGYWPWWAMYVFIIWFSASRSGLLGLAGGAVVWWLTGDRNSKALIVVAGVAVVGLVAAFLSVRGLFAVSGRDEYWGVAWQMFLSSPLTGTGYDTFQGVYTSLYPNNPTFNHAHSLYLNVLAEIGLLGFIATLALAWLWAWMMWIRREQVWARAALVAGASFFAHSLTDTPGTSLLVGVPLAIIIGMGLGDERREP